MDVTDFTASLGLAEPPAGLTLALQGLWWEAKGDWKRAHERAQQDHTPNGSIVHAYLHRVEGDFTNARYWYDRAGRRPETGLLRQEWESLARELLSTIQ